MNYLHFVGAIILSLVISGCDLMDKLHSVSLKPVPMMRCTHQCVKDVMQDMHNSRAFGGSSSMSGVTGQIKSIEDYCKRVYAGESCCHKSSYELRHNKPFKYETQWNVDRFGMCP